MQKKCVQCMRCLVSAYIMRIVDRTLIFPISWEPGYYHVNDRNSSSKC